MLGGAGVLAGAAAQAGPQVTLYLTLPVGGNSTGHVFGMRLDRSATPTDIRTVNPDSPLNRRALMDLQLGKNSALRLELARRLTWDINRQELRESARPPEFTLRLPLHAPTSAAAAPASPTGHADTAHAALAAALVNPLKDESWKPAVKALAVEP